MTGRPMTKATSRLRTASLLALALAFMAAPPLMHPAAARAETAAGTVISNTATATFSEPNSSNSYAIQTNTVSVTVWDAPPSRSATPHRERSPRATTSSLIPLCSPTRVTRAATSNLPKTHSSTTRTRASPDTSSPAAAHARRLPHPATSQHSTPHSTPAHTLPPHQAGPCKSKLSTKLLIPRIP